LVVVVVIVICSLVVEPQYPQLCIRQSDQTTSAAAASSEMLGPMELSAVLNSLPCSLTFTADDHLSVIQKLVALVSSSSSSTSVVVVIVVVSAAAASLLKLKMR